MTGLSPHQQATICLAALLSICVLVRLRHRRAQQRQGSDQTKLNPPSHSPSSRTCPTRNTDGSRLSHIPILPRAGGPFQPEINGETGSHTSDSTTTRAPSQPEQQPYGPLSPCPPNGPRHLRTLSTGPGIDATRRLQKTLQQLPTLEQIGRRRLELLVHNISHKDMLLSLCSLPCQSTRIMSENLVLCRPKFSLFQATSEQLIDNIQHPGGAPLVDFPVYKRERGDRPHFPFSGSADSEADQARFDRHCKNAQPSNFTFRQNGRVSHLPVGFSLRHRPVNVDEMNNFRLRRDDGQKLHEAAAVGIDGVYFPLLSNIVPKWRDSISAGATRAKASSPCQAGPQSSDSSLCIRTWPATLDMADNIRVQRQREEDTQDDGVLKLIFLVSGVGIPRDQTNSSTGNSTEGTAQLMKLFLRQQYPDLHIVRVHSTTNIFRYDENIAFVKTELQPLIEHLRDQTAESWGTEWRNKFNITISFANGSPARVSAINASLRPYRPSYVHMWELKSFWHHAKVCLDDVEVHSFEDIETSPPVPLAHADELAQMVAMEIMSFRQEVIAAYRKGLCKDMSTFWLRKTKRPVLAVLLVQKEGQEAVLYRGCNMEVSMPTGSLCAERNAIGSALAADLTLKRRDLKILAVLSLSVRSLQPISLQPAAELLPLQGVQKGSPLSANLQPSLDQTLPPSHTGIDHGTDEIALPIGATGSRTGLLEREGAFDKSEMPVTPRCMGSKKLRRHSTGSKEELDSARSASPPRVTVLRSYSLTQMASWRGGRDSVCIISVDSEDLNPLKPCGACMEWLKKIAEKNPQFRIATFTDESVRGVYLTCIVQE